MAERRIDAEDRIEGKNAVMEALKAGRPLDKIYIVRGEQDKAIRFIVQKGKAAGAVVSEVDRRKLDAMSVTHAHQGVIAVAALREYATVESILALAEQRGEAPLIVVCDEISDPHNLGAVIRTAECVGAHGIVIPKHRSAGVTAVVEKTSAGAAEHMAVARVGNLVSALEQLKAAGVWIYGTAADGDHRHRLGGNGDVPADPGVLRFPPVHPPAGAGIIPECIGGGRGRPLRSPAAENQLGVGKNVGAEHGKTESFGSACRDVFSGIHSGGVQVGGVHPQ